MKCKNCEFEYGEQYAFCPNCGTPKTVEPSTEQPIAVEPVSLNPTADKIMGALKDNGFLAICILMSISCVLSLSGGVPIINILLAIFLWLTYANAQKGFADESHLRSISGTVYASYIITNVASIILIVCGVLVGVITTAMGDATEFVEGFDAALSQYDLGEYAFRLADIPQELVGLVGVLIGGVFVIIAVIMLVLNILGIKKIHSFAKSVYTGIMYQNPDFQCVVAAKNWLMALGICSAIVAVFSLFSEPVSAIAAGCDGATAIIASVLINKHIIEKPQYAE